MTLKAKLEGVLGSVADNFHDVRADLIFDDEEVVKEAEVIQALRKILSIWEDVQPYVDEEDDA